MSRIGKCQATTKSGVLCSRDAELGRKFCWQHKNFTNTLAIPNKITKKNFNLQNLPADLFGNIGGFLELKESVGIQQPLKLPQNIYLTKTCAIIEKYDRKKLEQLYKINPKIKTIKPENERNKYLSDTIHMSVNRTISDNQRTHELVMYDFLYRYYQAELAKAKNR